MKSKIEINIVDSTRILNGYMASNKYERGKRNYTIKQIKGYCKLWIQTIKENLNTSYLVTEILAYPADSDFDYYHNGICLISEGKEQDISNSINFDYVEKRQGFKFQIKADHKENTDYLKYKETCFSCSLQVGDCKIASDKNLQSAFKKELEWTKSYSESYDAKTKRKQNKEKHSLRCKEYLDKKYKRKNGINRAAVLTDKELEEIEEKSMQKYSYSKFDSRFNLAESDDGVYKGKVEKFSRNKKNVCFETITYTGIWCDDYTGYVYEIDNDHLWMSNEEFKKQGVKLEIGKTYEFAADVYKYICKNNKPKKDWFIKYSLCKPRHIEEISCT